MSEPTESPFVKVIHKSLSGDEIVNSGIKHFSLLIKTANDEDLKLDATALPAFIAGFTSGLITLGMSASDAGKLGEAMMRKIMKVGGIDVDAPCDCPNCKGHDTGKST